MINKKTNKGKLPKELLDVFLNSLGKKPTDLPSREYINSLSKTTTYLRDDITAMLRNPDLKIGELEYLLEVIKVEIKRNQLLENERWESLDDEYPDGF